MLSQSQIASAWGPPCSGLRATVSLHGAGKVTVRAAIVEAVKAMNSCLIAWDYRTRYSDTGAFVCRQKVGGGGWSNHSYATAIDINWQLNPYGGSRHHIPSNLAAAICRIRTNNGRQVWNWGGYWRGTRDWMHFEIVCRPSDIATGINWNTVAGSKPAPPKPIDYAALRRWIAGDLEQRVSGLPTMWLNNAPHALYVVTLREALNLVLNEKLPVDGIYDADQDWQVQRFQKNTNKFVPGGITENLGTFGPQTKWWLVIALRNIRDGKA